MASPQRPDPNERQRSHDEKFGGERLARERMNRLTYGTGGFAWWSVFWIIVIALAIWWAGWGWGGSGGWWRGGGGSAVPYGTADTGPAINSGAANKGTNGNTGMSAISGPGLSALSAKDKQTYIGKTFQVNSVPVQNQVNDHVFWIGANNSTRMLVVLTGNGNATANTHIGQGTRMDVTGTIQKAPPQAQAQELWQLGGDNAAQLQRQGAYIQATQVHTVEP